MPAECLASLSLDAFNVVADGSQVGVSASATILEKRQDTAYVWSITVIDRATDKVVRDFLYKNQVFSLRAPATVSSTLSKSFELKPGSYLVEVRLFHIPRDFKLDKLMNKEIAASQVAVAAGHEIRIGNQAKLGKAR